MKKNPSLSPRKSSQSFSFSRRNFHRIPTQPNPPSGPAHPRPGPLSRIKSAISHTLSARPTKPPLGPRLIGTLFGPRRGPVRFAFQTDPRTGPTFLIELAMPTGFLVREMASGLVRIALECARAKGGGSVRLLEEDTWRAYCNGKKCGYAVRRDCGVADWRVLRAVQPVTMGAGVLPVGKGEWTGVGEGEGEWTGVGDWGEVMYMRARFERVVGSRDSEAFYMMNPDGNGGPELSIFLLRV